MSSERAADDDSADDAPAGSSGSMKGEVRAVTRLAVPLALVHLGQVALGAVDTAVVGRLGEIELGATGLGNSVYFVILVSGIGIMLGLDPLISQALGAGEKPEARRLLWQGVWIALLAGVPLVAVSYAVTLFLGSFGVEATTAAHTTDYLIARLPGFVPYLLFAGGRSYLQALGVMRPMVIGVILANVVNLPLSWLLVFGEPRLGIPSLGVAGAGWTSSVCSLLQMAVVVEAVRRVRVPLEAGYRRPSRDLMARAVRVGLPIGLTLLGEVGIFSIVNFLMANIDATALAGHQVAIQFAALTFMVPLGIGSAASVRVGLAVGRGDQPGTRRAGLVSIVLGMTFMAVAAVVFFAAPEHLARVITDKPDVITAAAPLVVVAAVFQLSDGVQGIAAGALRGAGDTRFALVANLVGHYAIGLPVAVLLGFRLGLGGRGLWWGLCAGLTAVAAALTVRFVLLTSRPIART